MYEVRMKKINAGNISIKAATLFCRPRLFEFDGDLNAEQPLVGGGGGGRRAGGVSPRAVLGLLRWTLWTLQVLGSIQTLVSGFLD